MDKALQFLQIQKQAFEAGNLKELGFHMVNTTKKLISYERAIFWTLSSFKISGMILENVSGNMIPDQNGPHAQWLKSVLKAALKDLPDKDSCIIVHPAALPENLSKDWTTYAAPALAILVFRSLHDHEIIGGLWIERMKSFQEPEQEVLKEVAFYYERAFNLIKTRPRRSVLPVPERLKRYRKYVWLALVLLALCPVRFSISAPVEIIPVSSKTVSVPFDGLMADIKVAPGDLVEEGQIIAQMDVEALSLQARTTAESLNATQAQLSRLRREVLSTPEKKSELSRLNSELKRKEIEAEYAASQLEKVTIRAPRTGIALFADVNDFEGKPVQTGQSLMRIADPQESQLLIRIPVQAMIPFDEHSPVSFFPNAAPLQNYPAKIVTIGYQASSDPDGLLTYKVRAEPLEDGQQLRIGWKGLARIQGDWTILGYRILRRPLITLRNMIGV